MSPTLNAEEAVKAMENDRVSVLFTEFVMTKKDGSELLTYMAKKHPHVPCVIMAESENQEIKKLADRKDIFQCIEKPFDYTELAWAIIDGLDAIDECGVGAAK